MTDKRKGKRCKWCGLRNDNLPNTYCKHCDKMLNIYFRSRYNEVRG